MSPAPGLSQHLHHLADVVLREAAHLAQIDQRLFGPGFGLREAAGLQGSQGDADLAERVDAFVARFGRLQDTLGAALLPRLLEALLEPTGSVLDNLNRADRLAQVCQIPARFGRIGPKIARKLLI